MVEGICNNKIAENQSFCIIRELEFEKNNKKLIRALKDAGFLNKHLIDDVQLDNLKNMVKQRIPNNVMQFQVHKIIFSISVIIILLNQLLNVYSTVSIGILA